MDRIRWRCFNTNVPAQRDDLIKDIISAKEQYTPERPAQPANLFVYYSHTYSLRVTVHV